MKTKENLMKNLKIKKKSGKLRKYLDLKIAEIIKKLGKTMKIFKWRKNLKMKENLMKNLKIQEKSKN